MRPGDWTCTNCGANVFASKMNCFKCGMGKPMDSSGGRPPFKRPPLNKPSNDPSFNDPSFNDHPSNDALPPSSAAGVDQPGEDRAD